VLTSSDIHAHNTFDQPHALTPHDDKNVRTGTPLIYRFAPASVTRLEFDLV
jgi:alpha-N-arabinofuranosidase